MTRVKPIVQYSKLNSTPVVGLKVFLLPVDHPSQIHVSNADEIETSPVVAVFGNGEFETQNSIYRPWRVQQGTVIHFESEQ